MRKNRSPGGAAHRQSAGALPAKAVKGLLSAEDLARLVKAGEIETVLAGFTDHYGRLMGKRFDAEMFVDEIAKHGGHACDYLLTVDMEMEPVPGYSFANWELGYGDCLLYTSPSPRDRQKSRMPSSA